MSELTKRLRKWQYEYEITDFGDAADRIGALEDSDGSRWHPCGPVVVKARALLEGK